MCVKVSGSYFTYSGDEDLLEKLVAEHGAAVSSVATPTDFMDYGVCHGS